MKAPTYSVGLVDLDNGVVVFNSAMHLIETPDGGYKGKTVAPACIPIPESLAGAPNNALVFITPAGLLAWEYDGKLVTRFDHVNK